MGRNFYAERQRGDEEINPVDTALERRFPHRVLLQDIRRITKALRKALGPRHRAWLELEELMNKHYLTHLGAEDAAAMFAIGTDVAG